MVTYDTEGLNRVAASISVDPDCVIEQSSKFESAALWFRFDRRAPKRLAPSELRRKLASVASNARRLLKSLGIDEPWNAADGPPDPHLLAALESAENDGEYLVLRATKRVGALVETLDAMHSAEEIERLSSAATTDSINLGPHVSPPGHHGDTATNNWIAAMMGVYRELTGNDPATSVGAPERPDEGIANGPLIRFLETASAPLGIKLPPNSWRERVRLIQKNSR